MCPLRVCGAVAESRLDIWISVSDTTYTRYLLLGLREKQRVLGGQVRDFGESCTLCKRSHWWMHLSWPAVSRNLSSLDSEREWM